MIFEMFSEKFSENIAQNFGNVSFLGNKKTSREQEWHTVRKIVLKL